MVVLLCLRPGSPGETLIPSGIGRGRHFLVSFGLLGPRLGCSVGQRDLWSELVVGVDELFVFG